MTIVGFVVFGIGMDNNLDIFLGVDFSSIGFSPKPFEILMDNSFNILWRVPKGTKITGEMEEEQLMITFTYNVPTQANIATLHFPKPVNLEKSTILTDRQVQPRKHVVRYSLPSTVIKENYTSHKSAEFIGFQFAVGRSTSFSLDIPQ